MTDSIAGLAEDALEAEFLRLQRRFWRAFGFVTGYGTLIFVIIAAVTWTVRSPHRRLSLLDHVDLGMRPADGLVVSGAMLATVVALNIALAAYQFPPDQTEQISAALWWRYTAFIATVTASGSVCVALICWLSNGRSDSAGNSVSLGLLALIAAAVAASQQSRASSVWALIAEERYLQCRLDGLSAALTEYCSTRPVPTGRLVRTSVQYFWSSVVLSTACGGVAAGVCALQGARLGWLTFFWAVAAGVFIECCLVLAWGRWTLVRTPQLGIERVSQGLLLAPLLGLPAALIALILVAGLPHWDLRAITVSYVLATLLLPVIAAGIDRRWPRLGLLACVRLTVGRILRRTRTEIAERLAEVRDRRVERERALGMSDASEPIRRSGTAALRRLLRRRRTRPAGRRNRPA